MIKHLKVEGFKCIRSFDAEIPPLCVLIGPNDSGKSSLLEAIQALAWTVDSPLHHRYGSTREGLEAVSWRRRNFPQIRWEAELSDPQLGGTARYSLTLGRNGDVTAVSEESLLADGTAIISTGPDGGILARDGRQLTSGGPREQTALHLFRRDAALALVGQVHDLLAATRRYQLDPQRLAAPSEVSDDAHVELGPRGERLASVLAMMKLADYERYRRIEEGLARVIPAIASVAIRPTKVPGSDGRMKPGHSLSFVLAGSKWEIPAEHASAGVLLFLGYLTLIHSEHPPRQVLIEEPENGIHPRRLQEIVALLRRLTQGEGDTPAVQIIMTTHSPYLLDFMQPEEVFIFRKDSDGGSVIRRMTDVKDLDDRLDDQSVGELWFNVGEEALVGADEAPR